jgi:hypothetical protein
VREHCGKKLHFWAVHDERTPNLVVPEIVGTASILIAREDAGTNDTRACPFGLARKAPT